MLEKNEVEKESKKQPVDDSKSVAGIFIFLGILLILGGIFSVKTQVSGKWKGSVVLTGSDAQAWGILVLIFGVIIVGTGIFFLYLANNKGREAKLDKMLHDKKVQLSNYVKNIQKK